MGNVYQAGHDAAVGSGMTSGSGLVTLREADGTPFKVVNANSKIIDNNAWSRDGTLIPGSNFSQYGTWECDVQSTSDGSEAGELLVQIPDSDGLPQQFFLLDQNDPNTDFPYTADLGEKVTVKPGSLDAGAPGTADIYLNGLSAYDMKYVLKNGTGTVLTTLTPTDGNHVALQYRSTVTPRRFEISSTLTFQNSSGSSWSAEEVEVQLNGNSNLHFQDSSFSVTVPDGSSLTFTTLQLAITNLV